MASASQSLEDPITDINVTPLVDVCLVLVIIFMAVAPMALTTGIKVLESKAKASTGKVAASENVEVKLMLDGTITVNGADVALGELLVRLLQAVSASKDKMVIVSADEKNRVGQVVEILDAARQAGAKKLAILKYKDAPAEAGS